MPAKSEAQRRLMGAALAMKRGKEPKSGQAGKLAGSMSEKSLGEFAARKEAISRRTHG